MKFDPASYGFDPVSWLRAPEEELVVPGEPLRIDPVPLKQPAYCTPLRAPTQTEELCEPSQGDGKGLSLGCGTLIREMRLYLVSRVLDAENAIVGVRRGQKTASLIRVRGALGWVSSPIKIRYVGNEWLWPWTMCWRSRNPTRAVSEVSGWGPVGSSQCPLGRWSGTPRSGRPALSRRSRPRPSPARPDSFGCRWSRRPHVIQSGRRETMISVMALEKGALPFELLAAINSNGRSKE